MKKIIFSICLFIFITSSYSICNANEIENSIAKVNAYEIMVGTDQGFQGEKSLTRAEAAAIFVRMYGISNSDVSIVSSNTKFTDVTTSHWACGYINKAVELGLLTGVGDNKFEPDRDITIAEFITIAVRSIGAQQIVDKSGKTWPTSYLEFAYEEGLLNNVNGMTTLASTRNDAACIVANTLDCNMWISSNSNNEVICSKSNTTFSEQKLGIISYNNVIITNVYKNIGSKSITWKWNSNSIKEKFDVKDTVDLDTIKVNEYYTFLYDKNNEEVILLWDSKTNEFTKIVDVNNQIKEEKNHIVINYTNAWDEAQNDEDLVGTADQKYTQNVERKMKDYGLSYDALFSTASYTITKNDFYNNSNKDITINSIQLTGFDKDGNITRVWNLSCGFICKRRDSLFLQTNIEFPVDTVTWGVTGIDFIIK